VSSLRRDLKDERARSECWNQKVVTSRLLKNRRSAVISPVISGKYWNALKYGFPLLTCGSYGILIRGSAMNTANMMRDMSEEITPSLLKIGTRARVSGVGFTNTINLIIFIFKISSWGFGVLG
jgi:hypothetical protein